MFEKWKYNNTLHKKRHEHNTISVTRFSTIMLFLLFVSNEVQSLTQKYMFVEKLQFTTSSEILGKNS